MALSVEEIKGKLKKPEKKEAIAKAILHETRLKFHVESFMQRGEISSAVNVFLDWVKSILPKDKYRLFLQLFQFPVDTTDLTENIFNELERVFDGRNSAVSYQFTSSELLDDWDEYRRLQLNEPDVWKEKAWDIMKTAINSLIVIDLPKEQKGNRPDPYFYFLDISCLTDYGYDNEDDVVEWVIFKRKSEEVEELVVIDDESYRVFSLSEKGEISIEPEIEAKHELTYCPVTFFWSSYLASNQKDLKKSPISSQLGKLDWLLFFSTSKKHLDLYAPYPIYSVFEAECDYENAENGDFCDGGFLRGKDEMYKIQRDNTLEACPVCAEKKMIGVGSVIEVPVPKDKDDPDLRNPISITSVDKASLDYNVEEVARLKSQIFNSTVGVNSDILSKQSINEKQVSATYETKQTIIRGLKVNIEKARRFVTDTVCRLRYGNGFISSSINLGTEFYIYSVNDLYAQYKTAKENGASETELDVINSQIIETEYRNNPDLMDRMRVLKHLEPYRHYTLKELIDMKKEGLLDETLLKIKINFNNLVDRFERENTNVIEFGSQVEFNKKIESITKILESYVKDRTGQPAE